jgi:seryl-tRNA synthetase
MLDLQFIRDNAEAVQENATKRGAKADVETSLSLDNEHRSLLKSLEEKRGQSNAASKTKPDPAQLEELKKLREQIKDEERQVAAVASKLEMELNRLPNMSMPDVPMGGPELNKVIKQVGDRRADGVEHWQIPGIENWIDSESAVRTSGSRFAYIVGDLAKVYYALMRFSQDVALKHGFIPHVPPVMVKREAMYGSGFFPANEEDSYQVNADEESLYLIGTSESVLVSRFADKVVDVSKPIRLTATTTCFRREAGTYGKDEKGLFRLHQFDKVEMVTLCKPEDSAAEHQLMLDIEEEVLSSLGLTYQVVMLAAGDSAIQSAKTYDCEAWFAGQQQYRELTSTSSCTDFQARRLKIRYKSEQGIAFVHTLNGTACSMGRPLACIMEQYQTEHGFTVPDVLLPYCGLREVRAS